MKTIAHIINDPVGIHARPAGTLAKLASEFSSDITITHNERAVSAKGILGVMGLSAKKGEEIIFTFEGPDEDIAYDKFTEFLKESL